MRFQLYVLCLITFSSFLSSCHVSRSLFFLRPDHKDGNKFAKHEIPAAEKLYNFSYAKHQIKPKEHHFELEDGSLSNLDSMLHFSKTNSVLFIKNDSIIYENYYNNYNENKPHLAFSVTKAMLSACMGLALEQGIINSYTDPIVKYIPELLTNDSAFAAIQVKHLFEMNSGIKIRGKDASLFGDLAKTYYGNNFLRFLKTIEIDTLPGGPIIYNQTDAELLTLILTRVSGQTLSEYVYTHIWKEIGAEKAFWNIYKKNDLERGYCCLNAKTRDFAKLARLFLQNGVWEGKQVLPKNWVSFVTNYENAPQNATTFTFYKHLFPSTDGVGDYTAQGFNGQLIYVNPSKKFILVRFGKREYKDIIDWELLARDLANKL